MGAPEGVAAWKQPALGLRVLVGVGIALILLSGSGGFPSEARAQDPGPREVYFPQTQHHVAEPFLGYWRANGGLPIFGYPVSEPVTEDGRTVQYFERARFEQHPELADLGYAVQIEHLGRNLLKEREVPGWAITPSDMPSDNEAFRYFEATGFHISHGFRDYWDRYGGLNVFGYPISHEFVEDGRTVQYFERVRFEWWPEHQGTRYEVLLELLGAKAAMDRGVDMTPVERRDGVPDYAEDLWNRELDLPALMYHRFGDPASRYQIPLWRFEQQLDWLQVNGYQTVTMDEVYQYLYSYGSLPPKPVMITIDDGFRSQLAAADALDRRGMRGVFFITTAMTDMTDAEIKSLADRGHEIASHTLTHASLPLVSAFQLQQELSSSKQHLEQITGREVKYFAYPYGDYNSLVVQAVEMAGYDGAVAAWGGRHWTPGKRWVQPRIEIGGTISVNQFAAYME